MKVAAMATFSPIPSSFQAVAEIKPQIGFVPFSDALRINEWKIVGDSTAMKRLRLQIRRIGPHFRTVLISGERGTGKELAARTLHQESRKDNGAFIAAAFGNRIAYLMKLARGGTLFFDGIDYMPLETQDELLEVLRRHEWAQDGLAAPQKLSARIIASTKQDLRGLVASGQFRQELYQRIAMVQIGILPLRKRMEDVPLLVMYFLDRFVKKYQKKMTIAKGAMELLQSHGWPGNARELEDVLEKTATQCPSGVIQACDLTFSTEPLEFEQTMAFAEDKIETTRLQDVMDQHVLRVLKNCAGNKLRAAELLGISRSTLYRMLDTTATDLSVQGRD